MALDLSAGLVDAGGGSDNKPDLSAGIVSPKPSPMLSIRSKTAPAAIDLSAGIVGAPLTARATAPATTPATAPASAPSPRIIDLSAGIVGTPVGASAPSPRPVGAPEKSTWDKIKNVFSDEYLGGAIGVLSKGERAIDQPIEKATQYAHQKIDEGTDWLLKPRQEMRDRLAASGHENAAKILSYGEAADPANWTREGLKIASGVVIDPKNWPLLLTGAPEVRPALKVAGSALFTAIQQTGAVTALRNHDYASASLNEAFALLGLRDLPAGVKETLGREAATHAEGPAAVVKEPAPNVVLADTAAEKAHIESQHTVGTAEGAARDTALFEQAKKELGPTASLSDIAKRAQELKTQGVETQNLTPHGPGAVSVEELQRPGLNFVVTRLGKLSYLGKQVDVTLKPGEALVAVDPKSGAWDVRGGNSDTAKMHIEKIMFAAGGKNVRPEPGFGEPGFGAGPVARVVAEEHIPVVSKSEILAEQVHTILDHSNELNKIGVDPLKFRTAEDVSAGINAVADHLRTNFDPRARAVITFDEQKQFAQELGMTEEEFLKRPSGTAYNAEQLIAARMILRDSVGRVQELAKATLSESSKLTGDKDAQRLSKAQRAYIEAIDRVQMTTNQIKGVTGEAGRALGSLRIEEGELPRARAKLANLLTGMSDEAKLKSAQLLAKTDPTSVRQINEFISKLTPSTTADQVFEYYRNALLSSPKTVTVKAASEVTMLALESMKKVVAAGLSKMGEPSAERFASESYYYAKGALQALQHTKEILSGEFDLKDAPGFETYGTQAIKGPLGTAIRLPQRVIERQTNLMYAVNYFGEIQAQAARVAIKEGLAGQELHARQQYLSENPTDVMRAAANELATTNTFQSELGKWGKKVQSLIKTDPTGLLRYVAPFFRTPVNLVKQSAYFSPYGLFKGLVRGDIDAQAKGLIGSSLAAGIAALALEGYVTGGGPTDYKKRQTLEATGWQPYSLKIGGRYYNYHRAEPLGLTFGIVADAVHGMQTTDSEVVVQSKADSAVAHLARNVDDFPFLMNLSSAMQSIHDPSGKRLDSFIAREVAGFVPAVVAQTAQAVDPNVRHPGGGDTGFLGTMGQTLESRTPGLTQRVPASIDITGKPLQRPASELGGINPFYWRKASDDPTVKELARLGISTPIVPAQIKLRGKPTQLSQAERQQLAQQEGADFSGRVGKAISSGRWQALSDDQKRTRISEIRRAVDDSRQQRLLRLRKQIQAKLARSSL